MFAARIAATTDDRRPTTDRAVGGQSSVVKSRRSSQVPGH
jgi:hypothetical protein